MMKWVVIWQLVIDICDKGDDGLTCFVSDSHKVMAGPIVMLPTKLLFAIS
jgi:hypothetical protein